MFERSGVSVKTLTQVKYVAPCKEIQGGFEGDE